MIEYIFILGGSHHTENPYFLTNLNKLCSDYHYKEVVDINSCYGAAERFHLEFTGKVHAWYYPRGCIVLEDHTEAKFNLDEVGRRNPDVGQVCKKTGTDLVRKSLRILKKLHKMT